MIPLAIALLAPAASPLPPAARAFVEAHCQDCHHAGDRPGGFDAEALLAAPDSADARLRWARAFDRAKSGEMPPAKKPRPPQTQADAALGELSKWLTDADAAARGPHGRAVARRLSRLEFENALRDLLELPGLDVRDALPEDGRAGGYARNAAALDVSPALLARYGEAIDKALGMATAQTSVPPETERRTIYPNQQYDHQVLMSGGDAVMLKDYKYDPRYPVPNGTGKYPEKQFAFGGKYTDLGDATRQGVFREPATVGLTRCIDESFQSRFAFSPIHPGRYRVTVSAWNYWWDKGAVKPAPRPGAVGVYLGGRLLGHFGAPSLRATESGTEVWLDPKPRDVFKVNPASLWNVHVYFSQGQAAAYSGPGVAIDWLKVEGPIHDEWPPPSHRRLFGGLRVAPLESLPAGAPRPVRKPPQQTAHDALNGPGRIVFGTVVSDDPAADSRKLLAAFLPRAFRRPVPADEVETFARLADQRRAEGACLEDAQKSAYRAALLSPDFLFRRESPGKLGDFALATRLSGFLWNGVPDDELLALAAAGRLGDSAILRQQTERLLNDPRSERFVADFLDQWLDLRDFDATTPDKALYPEWSPYLADAVRREPSEFFKAVLRGRAAHDLADTGFMVVNQRLAEHYGVPHGGGPNFVAVGVGDSGRGGLLGMAAIHKITANGTTTSPVKRGAWVLRKLLGTPPNPPPPDIPAVEPDVRGATTIREQLSRHRDNAACAGCHARMDPPGFALEAFDPIGTRRTRYRSVEKGDRPNLEGLFRSHLTPEGKFNDRYHVGFRDALPVDASGATTDGKAFKDFAEYRAILAADRRGLARNLVNQFVAYATGAPVTFADRPAVERVLDAVPSFEVRGLLHATVQSELFRSK